MKTYAGKLAMATMIAAGALLASATIQTASAQGGGSYSRGAYQRSTTYYRLPTVVRITPGMARILGPRRCDRSYPMDESMACGTATGGPVGGRGS